MPKEESAKEIVLKLQKKYGIKKLKEIVTELTKIINHTTAKVYHCGEFSSSDKEQIHKWLKNKIADDFDVEYIIDDSLIAGFKIVYKDFIYDASILNAFNNQIWKQKKQLK